MAVPELDIRMAVCRQDRAYRGRGPYIGVIHRITVVLPSGKRMNVGSNPAVEAGFFLARKTGVCYGYGAGVALGSQKQSIHA